MFSLQSPNLRLHLIYCSLLILVLFMNHPALREKESVRTVTKIVNHDVIKSQIRYVDRVIVTEKHNGDKVIITEHTRNQDDFQSTFTNKTYDSSKVYESYAPNYLFSAVYPVTELPFNPTNLQASVSVRAIGPLFVTAGTTGRFNTLLLGVTVEL